MNKHEYNKAKRHKGKLLRQEERAWKGKAQRYDAIMFGPVLERTTRLERFRAQKPALNPDGKPAHVHSVGVCSTIIAKLYATMPSDYQKTADKIRKSITTAKTGEHYKVTPKDMLRVCKALLPYYDDLAS